MLYFRLSAVLLLAAVCFMNTDAALKKAITCGVDRNVHRLSCDVGVIRVRSALYGRSDTQTCSQGVPLAQRTNTKCSQDGTLDLVRTRCNGKRVCELNLLTVRDPDPCPSTNKYLQTTFHCLPAIHMNICEGSVAHLFCARGQVIFVFGADYGRRDRDICSFGRPSGQLQNVNCSRPATKLVSRCNGRSKCSFQVTNSLFGDPCQGTYKYLELAYVCLYRARIPHPPKRY